MMGAWDGGAGKAAAKDATKTKSGMSVQPDILTKDLLHGLTSAYTNVDEEHGVCKSFERKGLDRGARWSTQRQLFSRDDVDARLTYSRLWSA